MEWTIEEEESRHLLLRVEQSSVVAILDGKNVFQCFWSDPKTRVFECFWVSL